jgi:L,D-transpeptidase YcbB
MISVKTRSFLLFILLCVFVVPSCRHKEEKKKPEEKDIVKEPEKLSIRISANLRDVIRYASQNDGKINDSSNLAAIAPVRKIYEHNNYATIWSADGKWAPLSDSLFYFIRHAKRFGLFPSDYHYEVISEISDRIKKDSMAAKDAALWSRADLFYTDALLTIAKHLKQGRLPADSLTLNADSTITSDFYVDVFNNILGSKQLMANLDSLEPQYPEYQELKQSIGRFLDSVKFKNYTYLPYPYIDSIQFFSLLKLRLFEEKMFDSLPVSLDTTGFQKVITRYQNRKKLKPTGRINERTVRTLNDTQWERYKRIAITLDKYKMLPDSMPVTYVWVNIPAFRMRVIDNYDSIALESKIIVGAAKTRTPELTSDISNFITYPQWTVPYSIIFKEMLPKIQKDTNFLKRQNLMVVDKNDSVLYPSTINWAKLSKDKFPYLIRQREGDDNSLGVLKFNFRNKYSVYLHDTNARWLFSKTDRALSHGCVRVQSWADLANFLVRNDSIKYPSDTLTSWIVRQEKHTVTGFKRVPIFIRYYTCETKNGRLRFYEDIYAEDKFLAEKYFSKNIN